MLASPPAWHPAPQNRAFTVVELLVVITIMATLTALMLPAISQAKDAAVHVKCSAQLHIHGIAHSTYQADNKNYYPAFGGPVVNDYSNWYRTMGTSNGSFWMIDYNSATRSYFRDYLNQNCTTASVATQKAQAVDYCPAIDWRNWGPYIFGAGYKFGYFMYPLPSSAVDSYAGYNFFTGQKFYADTYASDFDTRPRRDDPRELLVSDVVNKVQNAANNGSSNYNGQPLTVTVSVPWFNPHSGNCNTVQPLNNFHQLAASGAVSTYATSTATFTNNYGSGGTHGNYLRAGKTKLSITGNSLVNGPYFQVP